MLSAKDVAEYFLSLVEEDVGDSISNLKLQKLIYYAQGFHLAVSDTPLFDEPIEAWAHGPVVTDLYHEYKEYGSDRIPKPTDLDFDKYDKDVRELLDEVYDVFGQYSAWKLRNMTHDEPPWKDYQGQIIPESAMKEYFTSQLIDA